MPKIFSDQTNVRLNPPLMVQSQTEITSDQAIITPKWPLIRPFPQTEVTSDYTIVRSNPNAGQPIILVWKHTVCVGLGSDQRLLPSGTSTWENFIFDCLVFYNKCYNSIRTQNFNGNLNQGNSNWIEVHQIDGQLIKNKN